MCTSFITLCRLARRSSSSHSWRAEGWTVASGQEVGHKNVTTRQTVRANMKTGSKKVIYAALIGNFLVALTKFIAAAITGSSAMLSEGIHSVVDTGNQVLLLLGIHRSKRKASDQFPFGYGKEVYFWSFIVAILIFALGAGISMYEGIHHILHPREMTNPYVNYIVLALAIMFESAAWIFAITEFSRSKGKWSYVEAVKRSKDPTTFVVLFEDSAAILGLLTAFVGILLTQLTGIEYFDGIASIVIGFILAGTAMWLAYETKGLLIGESANKFVVDGIRQILSAQTEIVHINEVLTMHMGPHYILVNLSVDFADGISSEAVEATISKIDRVIKDTFPNVKRIFIEAEAYAGESRSAPPQKHD
jgi:cation diffusion facilitator family transporter